MVYGVQKQYIFHFEGVLKIKIMSDSAVSRKSLGTGSGSAVFFGLPLRRCQPKLPVGNQCKQSELADLLTAVCKFMEMLSGQQSGTAFSLIFN